MSIRHCVVLCAAVMVAMAVTSRAHPHDESPILDVKGTLTSVDLANRTIEVDVVDRTTKAHRSLLLFVDRKVKIRSGKARVTFGDLRPGQWVSCRVERQHDEARGDLDRMVAFEIQVDKPGR